MSKFSNGAILWEGPSNLNSDPIVVILTGLETPSSNRKTGAMIQTWIIHRDRSPTEAIQDGSDTAVCGHCPLRGKVCYVNLMPVNAVFRKFQRGEYSQLDQPMLNRIQRRHKRVRLGSYGDPAALPFEAWQRLLHAAVGHTGYTHQWRTCDPRWKDWLLASVESSSDAKLAWASGWRTFRIMPPGDRLHYSERLCRHAEDDTVTCEMCGLCDGGDRKPNIAIYVHGAAYKINHFEAMQTPLEITRR